LTAAGRLRLVQRCQHRPVAHVAAEGGVSRQCLSKWKARYELLGEPGLADRSSAPHSSPGQLPEQVVARIEALRRDRKWSARLIAVELAAEGITVSAATVGRWLVRLGLNRRSHLDPGGVSNRVPGKITARYPGHMIHVDVKKVGRIPDGGGWRAHGRTSAQHRAAGRAKTAGARAGYTYLHSAVDGFSRLAYTEALPDEAAATATGFFHRARAHATVLTHPAGQRIGQPSGRAAKSRLIFRYHPIPAIGFFHRPFMLAKALSWVSSPLATISFRWRSCAFMTSSAELPWSGRSHGPPICSHVMVFIRRTSLS
jgi:hypothetical protein